MLTNYLLPHLAGFHAVLAPFVEALLRVTVALCLVPHGLRIYFGMFPDTGMPINSLSMLIEVLDQSGYRPGRLWGPVIVMTELIGGPMLALGLFTRLVSIPIFILLALSAYDHRKTAGSGTRRASNTLWSGRWPRSISWSTAAERSRLIR
jgi:uncharacterized membrane protein YphA (DoxX/SURF4 family)